MVGEAMGRRYVYWRAPDGKPFRGDDKKHAPAAILAEIGKAATIGEEGGAGWKDLTFLRHQPSLRSAFVILDENGDELNATDSWVICHSAIDTVIKQGGGSKPVDPSRVIAEANKLAASHFRKQIAKYVLVSSLSIDKFPAKRIELHGCSISPLEERGCRFPLPSAFEEPVFHEAIVQHLRSTKYQLVKIRTEGRTIHQAVDTALDALNLLRGLWTLFATRGAWSMRFGNVKNDPIGIVHTGPIHTLHHPGGSLAVDNYWYEPDYVKDQSVFKPKSGWQQIEKNRRWTVSHLRRRTYREDLALLLMRYASALDNTDMSVAFLQMWSILEKITNTVTARYDDTIDRAIQIFSDRSVAKETLAAVRLRRNQYVHAARSGEDPDQMAYAVKQFVDHHLWILIRNDYHIESLEEYGKCLDMRGDVQDLKKQRRCLNQAIRIAKKREHGK